MTKIIDGIKLDLDDVLIVPQRSTLKSRNDVNLERTFNFYHSPRTWTGIPIVCSNMSFASFGIAQALSKYKIITCLHKYHTLEELFNFFTDKSPYGESEASHIHLKDYIWMSIGYSNKDIIKLTTLCEMINDKKTNWTPNICIDVPNGHIDCFVTFCKEVRGKFPKSIIMAGNVTTESMTQELIIHGGVDIVKCQIGTGSSCTTRMVAGVGYGSLSCILECSSKAHGQMAKPKHLGRICSDGGCRYVGDISKTFCAGADFCMLGGFFAGTEECLGEWNDGKTEFSYYGMSTHHSQKINGVVKKKYRASEGTKITVKNKGPIDDVIQELLGGLRSTCLYIGASSMKDMAKCAEFCRISKIHSNNNPVFGV